MGKEFEKEKINMFICNWITSRTPETSKTLLINYTPIWNKMFKKKKRKKEMVLVSDYFRGVSREDLFKVKTEKRFNKGQTSLEYSL